MQFTFASGDALLFRSKLRLFLDVDSHCIISSSPVENSHEAFQCSDGSFGVAVPTTFTALDGQYKY